ncbi:MAG: ATP-binding protein [Thermomicrobiales bacterium]
MSRLSLAQRFLIWSLIVLVVGMAGIGLWVSHQIEQSIIHRTASTTALYVDSLIAEPLQGLASSPALSPEATAKLDALLGDTPLGRRVTLFRVLDLSGKTLYSTEPNHDSGVPPDDPGFASAAHGTVSGDIGDIEGAANLPSDLDAHDLLEIYSPVWSASKWRVIAVAEFYYGTDDVRGDINRAKERSWMVVGGSTLVIYLLLAAFIRRASDTITAQQRSMGEQVTRLTELLTQNADLSQRVRAASARTSAINERFLRRLSAELHDGPAQDIGLALLQLDHLSTDASAPTNGHGNGVGTATIDFVPIEDALRRAMDEVRSLSSGLMLPQLGDLSLPETIEHAAQSHRRRTRSRVAVASSLPAETDGSLATRITVYRVVQEALTNAWRHAGGKNQRIVAGLDPDIPDAVRVDICDDGPGFDPSAVVSSAEASDHLGLVGMEERVEALGGRFAVESGPGGTCVRVIVPLQPDEVPVVAGGSGGAGGRGDA